MVSRLLLAPTTTPHHPEWAVMQSFTPFRIVSRGTNRQNFLEKEAKLIFNILVRVRYLSMTTILKLVPLHLLIQIRVIFVLTEPSWPIVVLGGFFKRWYAITEYLAVRKEPMSLISSFHVANAGIQIPVTVTVVIVRNGELFSQTRRSPQLYRKLSLPTSVERQQ